MLVKKKVRIKSRRKRFLVIKARGRSRSSSIIKSFCSIGSRAVMPDEHSTFFRVMLRADARSGRSFFNKLVYYGVYHRYVDESINKHVLGQSARLRQIHLAINLNTFFYAVFGMPFKVHYYTFPMLFLSHPRMTELASKTPDFIQYRITSTQVIIKWMLEFTLIFYASLYTKSTAPLAKALWWRLTLERE
jgi:hypothetical protein